MKISSVGEVFICKFRLFHRFEAATAKTNQLGQSRASGQQMSTER